MNFKHTVLVTLTIILSACSSSYQPSTDKNVTYPFDEVSSYYIKGDQGQENIMLSDIDRQRFDASIGRELLAYGLTPKTSNDADIIVSYFLVTKDKTKAYANGHSPYYAYNSRYGHAVGYSYGFPTINTKNYTEGTFVIDLIDNKSQQTVWRSTLKKSLKSYETPAEKDQAINELIEAMLAEFTKVQDE